MAVVIIVAMLTPFPVKSQLKMNAEKVGGFKRDWNQLRHHPAGIIDIREKLGGGRPGEILD